MMNTIKSISLRGLLLVSGLLIMAIGVDLSVVADLGVSPISSVPYVYSLEFPLTLGQTTIILHLCLVLFQMVLLGKRYKLIQLIQIPIGLLFGLFIDGVMPLLSWIVPPDYFTALALCLLSCLIVGLGVFLEVKAKLTYLAGEGAAIALSQRFGLEFGNSKIKIDSSLVAFALMSSIVLLGNIQGIREGTIVAALLVGLSARFFSQLTDYITRHSPLFAQDKQ